MKRFAFLAACAALLVSLALTARAEEKNDQTNIARCFVVSPYDIGNLLGLYTPAQFRKLGASELVWDLKKSPLYNTDDPNNPKADTKNYFKIYVPWAGSQLLGSDTYESYHATMNRLLKDVDDIVDSRHSNSVYAWYLKTAGTDEISKREARQRERLHNTISQCYDEVMGEDWTDAKAQRGEKAVWVLGALSNDDYRKLLVEYHVSYDPATGRDYPLPAGNIWDGDVIKTPQEDLWAEPKGRRQWTGHFQ